MPHIRRDIPSNKRIFVAVDTPDVQKAIALVNDLRDYVGGFKFGLEFFWGMIQQLLQLPHDEAIQMLGYYRRLVSTLGGGPQIMTGAFVDGKLDDIENTVGKAAVRIAALMPWCFNVHASAGVKAVMAAVAARGTAKVFGVTVLTSIDNAESTRIFGDEAAVIVPEFAKILIEANADGIICSAQEVPIIRADSTFDPLITMCPGIRSIWYPAKGQARTLTPTEAILAGVDHMVIGRPITDPIPEHGSPVAAVKVIISEIEEGLRETA